MERSTKITVIVPVFNGRLYLDDLMVNFHQQTTKDFEVIFVNDGSTDGTKEKLDTIAMETQDFRVRVIHQKNAGVSAARNRGIDTAEGKYICFIDADDAISENYFELLLKAIEEHSVHVAVGFITRTKQDLELSAAIETSILSKAAFLREFLYRGNRFHICATLFDAQRLHEYGLRFPEGYRYSEDVYFLWQLFAREKQIAVIPCPIYCYVDNPVSAMNRKINLNRKQAIVLMEKLETIIQEYAPEFSNEFCQYAVARHHWSILWQAACMLHSYREFQEYVQHFEMKQELKKLYSYPGHRISWSARLYSTSPWMYYHLIRIYKRHQL